MKNLILILFIFIGINVNAQIENNSEIDSIKIAQKQIEFYIKKHENELFRLKTDLSNTKTNLTVFNNRINQFSDTKRQAQNLRIAGWFLNLCSMGLFAYSISESQPMMAPYILGGIGSGFIITSLFYDKYAVNELNYEELTY